MFGLEELLDMTETHRGIVHPKALEAGTRLSDSPYVIQELLNRSELYFVYLGVQTFTGQNIIIKEFYPQHAFSYEGVELQLDRVDHQMVIVDETEEKKEAYDRVKKLCKEDGLCIKRLRDTRSVINGIETMFDNNTTYRILEYLPFPDLRILLKHKQLTLSEAIKLFEMILLSFKKIHDMGYAYKRLTPYNVFISDQQVILGDFHIDENFYDLHYYTLERPYEAPEIKAHKFASAVSDIYSLGMIFRDLMAHVGYDFENKKIKDAEGFDVGKIDYLLTNMLIEDPYRRIQSVDEVLDFIKDKPVIENSKSDYIKAFVALIVTAIIMIALLQTNLSPTFISDAESYPAYDLLEYRFTKASDTFRFGESIDFEWENIVTQPYYQVRLECCHEDFEFKINRSMINLDSLCLNPNDYILTVTDVSGDIISHHFKILENENASNMMPLIAFENYAYYEGGDILLSWENFLNRKVRFILTNLSTQEIIEEKIISNNFKTLDLDQGEYLVSLQTFGNQRTYYDHAKLLVLSEDEIKPPILYLRTDQELKRGDFIKWEPIEGILSIKLLHEAGERVTINEEALSGKLDLSSFNLESGAYDIIISRIYENRSSRLVNRRIFIID